MVLRVKRAKEKALLTVLGKVVSANGEWIRAEGSWQRDQDHGMQFGMIDAGVHSPGQEGIEKYLASGMIKGIGPVYAKKMVQKFGDEVFDIIEHASARLETIEGIGRAPKIDQGCLAGTEGHSGYHGLFAPME